jgi:hypothetical protein
MIWKIDNIDLKTYGVYVSKSSGVLDLPQIVDVSTDWLDLNGREYWQDIEDVKYSDNEISLTCWILAGDYADFKAKVAAFFTAITAAGVRSLETPFGNTIDVSLQSEVQVVRKTSYIQSLQAGTFTIRLTVSGDSKTKLITVYRSDGSVHNVFNYGSDARLNKDLMGRDEITFNLELNYMSDDLNSIAREDYILYDGAKYYTLEHPEVQKYSNNKYIHGCTFQHEFFRTKDVQFRLNGESDFYWYATLDEIITNLVACMNALFPGLFAKGTIAETIYKNHQFQNENCFATLARITEDYGLEYDHLTVDGVITISVVEQVGNTTGITLGFGKGSGISMIKLATAGLREKMVTRLYAYGSEKNLPVTYGSKRLKLATEPLTKDFWGIIIEQTKVWDDIYPERTGTVTSYAYTPSSDLVNYPERSTYNMVDSSFPFDLKEIIDGTSTYLISGTTAKIHFNSGDLAGFEFEVLDYDHATKTFSLIPLKQSNETTYPNAVLYPNAGDTYVLLDIKLPQSYIDDAEARLLVRAQEYIDFYYQPYATFEIEIHPSYTTSIGAGDVIYIDDSDFTSETEPQRVAKITQNLYLGGSTLTVSQILKLSNRQLLEKKVNEMDKVLNSVAITDANDQRNSTKTVGELSNKLINPLDEKFNADELVRDESIDARMLSYESGVPQFEIGDALMETNIDDNEDKARIGAGTITMLNWRNATLNRKEIEKLTEPYDPTRTWIISQTDFTLLNKLPHHIYAKLDMTEESTDCTIEVFDTRKRVREDFTDPGGFIRFKLGSITSGEEAAV